MTLTSTATLSFFYFNILERLIDSFKDFHCDGEIMTDETKDELFWLYDQLGLEASIIPPDSSLPIPGEMIVTDHHSYILGLCEIEKFVREVIATKEMAYTPVIGKLGVVKLKELELAKYFRWIDKFAVMYLDEYEYSHHVKLFFYCYRKMELRSMVFTNPQGPTNSSCLQYERYHALIDLIRSSAATDAFKAAIAQRTQTTNRRVASASKSIGKAFRSYSRLLVIRLDLSYRKEFFPEITAERAKKDLRRFFWNWRHKKSLFGDCVYYLWKLEYGLLKGYHFHLVLFYNGRAVRNDAFRAHAVGEYWKDVTTKGKGAFFNCNVDKAKYRYVGIGMVKWDDEEKRRFLLEKVVTYLAKSDQYLRAKRLRNSKCFNQKQVPELSGRGRHRNGSRQLTDLELGLVV